MSLQLSGSGPELTVHWDRNARALTDIVTAELVISDGPDAMKIPLTAENLLGGNLSYVRRTGKVDVTLRTRSRTNELYEAVAHYVGPAPAPPVAAKSNVDSAEVERMRAEMERLNSELVRMRFGSAEGSGDECKIAHVRITSGHNGSADPGAASRTTSCF